MADFFYPEELMNARAGRFVKILKEKELKVAFAESITCGLATEQLSSAIGTSEVLAGSVVCYSPEVKKELMHVPQKMIDKHSCESMEVTEALVKHLPKLIKADIYAALTGLASEGGSETSRKPVGTVFFCVKYKNRIYRLEKLFRGTPAEIKEKACLEMYHFIRSLI